MTQEDKLRLEEALLRELLRQMPDSSSLRLYERGIVCPTLAAAYLLQEYNEKKRDTNSPELGQPKTPPQDCGAS